MNCAVYCQLEQILMKTVRNKARCLDHDQSKNEHMTSQASVLHLTSSYCDLVKILDVLDC